MRNSASPIPLADVAFMVMDLENHGRRNLADLFCD